MANMTRKQQDESGQRGLAQRGSMPRISDLLRWDPFGEMATTRMAAFPTIEVKETKEAFVFKADLPGMKDEDVDVQVHGNRLTIGGERREEERSEGDRYYAYERSYGGFSRSFTLPDGADLDAVQADLRDGVLTVKVPKKPEIQPKKISVGGGQAARTPGKERPS